MSNNLALHMSINNNYESFVGRIVFDAFQDGMRFQHDSKNCSLIW